MLAGIRKLGQESELDKGHNKDTVSYESEENVAFRGGAGYSRFAEAGWGSGVKCTLGISN